MAEFRHLVLTRFNTAVSYAPGAPRLNPVWLKTRFELFERFCLASMASQEDAEFRWLVFFDAESPEWVREKVHLFGPLVTPIYVDGLASDQVISRLVAESGLASAPHLITTRVDNDDALGRNHLAQVQRAFRGQEREFVSFPFGLQWFRGHLYNVYWPSNPFLSLIERVKGTGEFTTVLCARHDRMRDTDNVKLLIRTPQWLQSIHGGNLVNALRGTPRIKSGSHRNFDIQWSGPAAADGFTKRVQLSASAYARRLMRKTITRLDVSRAQ
jgi:hypothetical protein